VAHLKRADAIVIVLQQIMKALTSYVSRLLLILSFLGILGSQRR
jgi:hypothetical protein